MDERSHVVVLCDDTGTPTAVWGTYSATGAEKVCPLLEDCYPGTTAHPFRIRARHLPGRLGAR